MSRSDYSHTGQISFYTNYSHPVKLVIFTGDFPLNVASGNFLWYLKETKYFVILVVMILTYT